MDKRVELHDHTRRVDMNGECGVTATDCHCSRDDKSTWRHVHGQARLRRGVQGQAGERVQSREGIAERSIWATSSVVYSVLGALWRRAMSENQNAVAPSPAARPLPPDSIWVC